MHGVASTVGKVRYPYMRLDLREYAGSLCDEAHQKRVWVEHGPSEKQDTFTDVVHFFYDDAKLADDPHQCIGWFLRSAGEAGAVRALTSALDALFDELGTKQPDGVYLQAPGWPRVVLLAKELAALLDRSDEAAATA